MIYGFTVENYLGKSLKFTLSDGTPTHGLIVKEITGLGPVKATINISNYATKDGGRYNSSRMEKRNITITFKIKGNYNEQIGAVEYSRDLTYKFFPLKKRVHLIFDQMDHRQADIYGYVESNEPKIFSNDEETTISIICDDPYFYRYGYGSVVKTDFSPIEPLFEFPVDNPVDTREIEFGNLDPKSDIERKIVYEGDVEIGFKMTIHFNSLFHGNTLNIVNVVTNESMRIYLDRILTIVDEIYFEEGDEIVISTEASHHYVRFIKNGVETNIINAIDRYSDWLRLINGDNVFVYVLDPVEFREGIDILIENKTAYEGI